MTKKRNFTKIRKWANEVGATVRDSDYFDAITVTLPDGKKYEFQNKESTSRVVISRGRGLKREGHPAGLFITDLDKNRFGYAFPISSQVKCIEKMEEYMKNI